MVSNKRKRSRVDAGFEAVLSCGGIEKHTVKVKNLSLKGMLCEPSPNITSRKACSVTITLSDAVVFSIEVRLVRNDDQGLALDFEGMDETAFFHLRNLVRYHSQDPDSIDKELSVPAFTAHHS